VRNRLDVLRELRGPGEAALFARVGLLAITVPLLMRLPLGLLSRLLSRRVARRRAGVSADRLADLVSLAVRAGYPLVRPGCLTRGVTLYWFLRRGGHDVELHFGLDPADEQNPEGHCWLTLGGEPVLEKIDPARFAVELYRLPSGAA
jgi:hypothetical protein